MAQVIVRQQLGKIRVELDTGDLSIDVDSDGNGYQTAHALAPFMQALCDSCDAAHAALVDAHYAKGGVPAVILGAAAAAVPISEVQVIDRTPVADLKPWPTGPDGEPLPAPLTEADPFPKEPA